MKPTIITLAIAIFLAVLGNHEYHQRQQITALVESQIKMELVLMKHGITTESELKNPLQ